ncbi:hypothetical protein PI124_g8710 [Phytophthora idaei]|nr:hypothetical protein PI124_g8710 [Phytophthora idaei]
MSLTVRWLYTLEDPLVRLVDDGSLTRNTVSCSVHYVDVGMWASFSKSLAVLLRRTLWPGVEPGNAYSLTHHTDKSLFFSNEVDCFIASKRTSARGFDGTTPRQPASLSALMLINCS